MYIYTCVYLSLYIYIYRERENLSSQDRQELARARKILADEDSEIARTKKGG